MSGSGKRVEYAEVMEAAGYYGSDGRPLPSMTYSSDELIRAGRGCVGEPARVLEHVDRYFKYEAILRPENERGRLGVTDVFELSSGAPCIYFKRLEDESDAEHLTSRLLRWQRTAWNHGRAPMLWVVTPTQVRILNAYALPPHDGSREPLNQVQIRLFDSIGDQLHELREFASRERLQSGEFWNGGGLQVDRKHRVDARLVADVKRAAKRLEGRDLPLADAHRLLLRGIFARYLEERGWLPKPLLHRYGVSTFTEALGSAETAGHVFGWLARTFNGDVFPSKETTPYTEAQLEDLQLLLCGGNPETGQMYLWPYEFDVIPIELLSSVYEEFAHALDKDGAEQKGTHYTPVNLVDLTLSEVFNDHLFGNVLPPDAKVLDLSCGSGVFLAESLRRLVGRRLARGEALTRDVVRNTLYNQVFGVDVNSGAIHVAAISLYLAALELEPEPVLDEGTRFLPLIAPRSGAGGHTDRPWYNLYAEDAFDEEASFNHQPPFSEQDLSIVVGNPPWTRPEGGGVGGVRSDGSQIPPASHVSYAQAHQIRLPAHNHPDQAFVWRGTDFARRGARFGVILGAGRFFSHAPASVQAKQSLLTRLVPRAMVNLSDMRLERLFPRTTHPALVLIAQNLETSATDTLLLAAPRRCRSFRRHGVLEIVPEDVKQVSGLRLAEDPDLLKIASYGSCRDERVIAQLRQFGALDDVLGKMGQRPSQGFIRGTSEDAMTEIPGEMLNHPWRCLEDCGFRPFFLDRGMLPYLDAIKMERPRSPSIYKGPLLLFGLGLGKRGVQATIAEGDVVYSQRYYGIRIPSDGWPWAWCVVGILNSSVAAYFAFLTGSKWGVERPDVTGADLLRLPVPSATDCLTGVAVQVAAVVQELGRQQGNEPPEEHYERLDSAVFDLYGLDARQRVLVRDMVDYTISLQRPGGLVQDVSTLGVRDLIPYAENFISVVDEFLGVRGKREALAEVLRVPTGSPLRVVRFATTSRPAPVPKVTTVPCPDLRAVLARVSATLPGLHTDHIVTQRHLRLYGPNEVYIVKPAQMRFWSGAAGINDADAVIADELGGRG